MNPGLEGDPSYLLGLGAAALNDCNSIIVCATDKIQRRERREDKLYTDVSQ